MAKLIGFAECLKLVHVQLADYKQWQRLVLTILRRSTSARRPNKITLCKHHTKCPTLRRQDQKPHQVQRLTIHAKCDSFAAEVAQIYSASEFFGRVGLLGE